MSTKYFDIMPLTRKAEFDFLMAMRKPQTKIVVVCDSDYQAGLNQAELNRLTNMRYDAIRAGLSVSSMESAISAVQSIQGVKNVCEDELIPNKECASLGRCSWFRHSQDTYKKYGVGDNLLGFDRSIDELWMVWRRPVWISRLSWDVRPMYRVFYRW